MMLLRSDLDSQAQSKRLEHGRQAAQLRIALG
jgi:hypothetical protein